MILVKCAVTGREVYKKICSKLIVKRENITFESRPWCTFFSRWSYDDNLFWTYHPHIYAYYTPWKPDVNSNVETITHDFNFLKFLKLSFLLFSVMREITEVCYHFFITSWFHLQI